MLYVPHELGGEAGAASLDAASLGLGRLVRDAPGVVDGAARTARYADDAPLGRTAYLVGGGGWSDEAAEQVLELSGKYRYVEVVDIDPDQVHGLERMLQLRGGAPPNVHIRTMAAADLGTLADADIFVVAPNPDWLYGTPWTSSLAEDLDLLTGPGSRAYVVSELKHLEEVLTVPGVQFKSMPQVGSFIGNPAGPSPFFRVEDALIYSDYFRLAGSSEGLRRVYLASLIR